MGTHDVSLLTISDGTFEVKATSGDTHLGGEDIDNIIVDHCVREFQTKYKKNLRENQRSLRRLRTACERAKRTLSSSASANIEIDALFDGIDYNTTISRAKYESLCTDVFNRTIRPVEQVLQDSKMSKSEIHEVVLVGGSSRIPRVRELLSNFFNGKTLNQSINPDEAVAYGAACQGVVLSGVKDSKFGELLVIDVCSLSLGIETAGGVMTRIIERNTTIPCKKTQEFSTYSDNQPAVTVKVFEGERPMTRDCNKLGEFNLSGIPPMPRGVPKIEVTFDLDSNGILNVSAAEKSTGKSHKITIKNDKGRLSKDDIDRMVNDAKKFEEEDKKVKEKIEARNNLENYVYGVRASLTDDLKKNLGSELSTVESTIEEGIKWLEENTDESKETYDSKRKELEGKIMPVMMKMYQSMGGGAGGMPDMKQSGSSTGSGGPTVDEVD
jgi:heat shock 70kDa protein 1/2/6/8